ncbi:hypothetical protein P2G88_14575 [Aliiglaciecola sp. CAU 1673]|uniref:hypothetical protein n=1 Tax=Aliiglaciecola sp. CAU 1673 TaxID=3032595 RepID=UPI0023DA5D1F|nr:hypothetical protein [Aliiglaciecola sp. CAU 1673]MDF2179476.1 hypothetical protein [Aliiglaciecola sp. CAU 1673]
MRAIFEKTNPDMGTALDISYLALKKSILVLGIWRTLAIFEVSVVNVHAIAIKH